MKTKKQNDYKSINIDPIKETYADKVQVENLPLNFYSNEKTFINVFKPLNVIYYL